LFDQHYGGRQRPKGTNSPLRITIIGISRAVQPYAVAWQRHIRLTQSTRQSDGRCYINEYLAACKLYSDIKATLSRLAAYPMGIISNGERSQQQQKLVRTMALRRLPSLPYTAERNAPRMPLSSLDGGESRSNATTTDT